MLRILYAGESGKGSSSRALREALDAIPSVTLDEVDVDHFLPPYRSRPMRAAGRLLRRLQRAELEREMASCLRRARPDVLLIYKGYGIGATVVEQARRLGILTVNVYPDHSPHTQGRVIRDAMGVYDVVISTKPFHPGEWKRVYGYSNRCVCVPHGYQPSAHYWSDAPGRQDLDVVMAATWRKEYHVLMQAFAAETAGDGLTVGVAGNGWIERRREFPATWAFADALTGRSYGEFVRAGRIVIAPVQRIVVVGDVRQPGDEDTIRTYELAAAQCFFVHQRTDYVRTVYDEQREVPLWNDARELASLVRRYLPCEDVRRAMAAAAHARAVPHYSIDGRARQVVDHIQQALARRTAAVTS